jgi:hypothetical protein
MAGHADPSNDRWLTQQPFFFYDQAHTWIGILVNQVIDSEKSLSSLPSVLARSAAFVMFG